MDVFNAVLCEPLNRQRQSGLNSDDCPGGRGYKFIVPLKAFMTSWCTETGSLQRIKDPCSALRLTLEG
jgi:hypothetical protein